MICQETSPDTLAPEPALPAGGVSGQPPHPPGVPVLVPGRRGGGQGEEGRGERKVTVHLIFFSISASVRVSRKGLQMSASLWFLGVQVVVSVVMVADDDNGGDG